MEDSIRVLELIITSLLCKKFIGTQINRHHI